MNDDFLDLVAHELRTPLASVLGFAEILVSSWDRRDDEERLHLVKRVLANAREANDLVARLVDFGRLRTGRATVHPHTMKVADGVEGCIGNTAPLLGNHPLTVDVPDGLTAAGDPDAFGQVLSNLLVNAARFSEEDAPIHVRAEEAGDEVVVSVSDRGMGIAEDERERIFDDFYRAPEAAASGHGVGVGLAVAKGYVGLLGGRIWVESEPGRGATFSFTLPSAEGPER